MILHPQSVRIVPYCISQCRDYPCIRIYYKWGLTVLHICRCSFVQLSHLLRPRDACSFLREIYCLLLLRIPSALTGSLFLDRFAISKRKPSLLRMTLITNLRARMSRRVFRCSTLRIVMYLASLLFATFPSIFPKNILLLLILILFQLRRSSIHTPP